MAQLMPLPLTVSCFSKIQIGFTFLVPAHLGSPGKMAVKRVCVCVCLLKFQQCSLRVWNLCPDGNMHGIDTLGGLDSGGSTDNNLPYFVVENLATLIEPLLYTTESKERD